MAKSKQHLDEKAAAAAPPGRPWPRAAKLLVSLLVAWHIFCVFTGPWAMPQQASPLAADCRQFAGPYIEALFLSNGYRFFAPEPGPSHIVRYELKWEDGRTETGQFPDRNTEWPRLFYHRHFMMSETLNTLNVAREADNPVAQVTYDLYLKSYARHLLLKYDAAEVKLTLVRHLIPIIEELRDGKMTINDPRLFEELSLGTFRRDQL